MENNLDRQLAERSFEYGKHTITITVSIEQGKYGASNVLNRTKGYYCDGCFRRVKVAAQQNGEDEVTHTTRVHLNDRSRKIDPLARLYAKVFKSDPEDYLEQTYGPLGHTPADEQIEITVRDVFEELDTIYQFTEAEYTIDVEVGIEKVRHELSWVEVEDEIERISREVDAITEPSD